MARATATAQLSSVRMISSSRQLTTRAMPALPVRKAAFRCMASPLKDAEKNVDQTRSKVEQIVDSTKVNISKEDVQKHQESGAGDENRSVVGSRPAPGNDQLPRPELERRPETGDNSFGSVMAFDGVGPETINGRLAMMGVFIALSVELFTGLTVWDQVLGPGAVERVGWFFALTQLIFTASLVPFSKRESPDSRRNGPFTAKAERWNGRLAMLGFAGIILTEVVKQGPLLPHLF